MPCVRHVQRRSTRRSAPGRPTRTRGRSCAAPSPCGTQNGRVETLTDARDRGDRRPRARRRRLGLRVRPAARREGARDAALRAVRLRRRGRRERRTGARPARGALRARYRPPVELDPFAVSLDDKVALCLRAEEAIAHAGASRSRRPRSVRCASESCSSPPRAPRSSRSSSSAAAASTRSRSATTGSSSSAATRAPTSARARRPAGSTSRALGLEREAPRVAEQAAALLRADECPAGVTTVVIDAEQMQLQVHESVGHPTELDRVYGTEAAYAGTSFLHPGDLGTLRYGSEHMNITADPTTPGGLGTFGFDDEGVPAAREPIVSEGVLSRLPHLARDRGADRPRRRRLDARRRLAADAARPDDEPPPGAGLGDARGADLRGRPRGCTSRRTAAGRSTTSASTSSSARRWRGRSSAAEARAAAARRDLHRRHAAYSGARWIGSPGPRRG